MGSEFVQWIKAEDIVPITGPPGTGKSTVISHSKDKKIKQRI